jgi:hypothetical protein
VLPVLFITGTADEFECQIKVFNWLDSSVQNVLVQNLDSHGYTGYVNALGTALVAIRPVSYLSPQGMELFIDSQIQHDIKSPNSILLTLS